MGSQLAGPAPAPTQVAQALPTGMVLPTITATFTPSNTPPPTLTFTPTFTHTPTDTPVPPTGSATPRPTFTATLTFTPGPTGTTPPTATITPSETIRPTDTVPPSATLTFTPVPSQTITATLPFTATPQPTSTPLPTATQIVTIAPIEAPSPYPFALRDGQPVFAQNFANTAGCAWQGIGGQVFDLNDQPLLGVTIHVFGNGVDARVTSGTNTIYGIAGWEVPLNSMLTGNSYLVELLSPAGTPISPQFTVTFTMNDCARNLALVNFKQTRPL
ncbi:MAG: hypothetical protein IPK19_01890 [Chloroflexi bacterium]|nr:hypothetical protein [Chloroflexota bacterium]